MRSKLMLIAAACPSGANDGRLETWQHLDAEAPRGLVARGGGGAGAICLGRSRSAGRSPLGVTGAPQVDEVEGDPEDSLTTTTCTWTAET